MVFDETYPLSRNERNCELVKRRGSPVPSAATASNSSNGGVIKRSRKLIGRVLRFIIFSEDAVVVDEVVVGIAVDASGVGKSVETE